MHAIARRQQLFSAAARGSRLGVRPCRKVSARRKQADAPLPLSIDDPRFEIATKGIRMSEAVRKVRGVRAALRRAQQPSYGLRCEDSLLLLGKHTCTMHANLLDLHQVLRSAVLCSALRPRIPSATAPPDTGRFSTAEATRRRHDAVECSCVVHMQCRHTVAAARLSRAAHRGPCPCSKRTSGVACSISLA